MREILFMTYTHFNGIIRMKEIARETTSRAIFILNNSPYFFYQSVSDIRNTMTDGMHSTYVVYNVYN